MAHLAYYREAHPLPFVLTHWINLICVFLLMVTGIVIHNPFFGGTLGLCRGIHIFCAFLLLMNMLTRIALSFVVKSAPTGGTRKQVTDFHNWLPQIDNKHQRKAWIDYYLFKRSERPMGAKYGVLRKAYLLISPLLIFIMFYTGCALWSPTMMLPFFAVGTAAMGGLMNMRIIHYSLMFVFICYTLIHAYFVSVEGWQAVRLMFFRKEEHGYSYDPDKHIIDLKGYDPQDTVEDKFDDDLK